MNNDPTILLTDMMLSISRQLKQKMVSRNNPNHVSVLQVRTLKYLDQHKKATMSNIADFLNIELPSATSLINKLSDLKLVKRSDDPQDRRLVRLALTAEGKKLLDNSICRFRTKLEKILSVLTGEEQLQLLKTLKVLHQKLQE